MIYLIGVNHFKVQFTTDNADVQLIEAFARYLKEQAEKYKIALIAEELSKEVLCKYKAKACTAQDVATELGIWYRPCDPNSLERKKLGIPSECEVKEQLGLGLCLSNEELERLEEEEKKYWSKREQFWFDCIADKLHEPTIFICGVKHVERFQSLLINRGYEVRMLVKNWCKQESGA